jgi:hypothetical protein
MDVGCQDDYGELFGRPGVAYDSDTTVDAGTLDAGSGDFSDSTTNLVEMASYAIPSTVSLLGPSADSNLQLVISSGSPGLSVHWYIGHSPSDIVSIGSGGNGTYTLDIVQSGITCFLPGDTIKLYVQGFGGSYSFHWVATIGTANYLISNPLFPRLNDLRVSLAPAAGWEQPGFDDSAWVRPVGVPRHPNTSQQQVWSTQLPLSNTEALSARLTCTLDPAGNVGHPVGSLQPYEVDITIFADRTLTALYLNGTAVTIPAPTNIGEGVNGYVISADASLIVASPPYRNVVALTVQNAAYTPTCNPTGVISPDTRGDRAGLSVEVDIFGLTCAGGYAYYQLG